MKEEKNQSLTQSSHDNIRKSLVVRSAYQRRRRITPINKIQPLNVQDLEDSSTILTATISDDDDKNNEQNKDYIFTISQQFQDDSTIAIPGLRQQQTSHHEDNSELLQISDIVDSQYSSAYEAQEEQQPSSSKLQVIADVHYDAAGAMNNDDNYDELLSESSIKTIYNRRSFNKKNPLKVHPRSASPKIHKVENWIHDNHRYLIVKRTRELEIRNDNQESIKQCEVKKISKKDLRKIKAGATDIKHLINEENERNYKTLQFFKAPSKPKKYYDTDKHW